MQVTSDDAACPVFFGACELPQGEVAGERQAVAPVFARGVQLPPFASFRTPEKMACWVIGTLSY
jgi:hypothetical protein